MIVPIIYSIVYESFDDYDFQFHRLLDKPNLIKKLKNKEYEDVLMYGSVRSGIQVSKDRCASAMLDLTNVSSKKLFINMYISFPKYKKRNVPARLKRYRDNAPLLLFTKYVEEFKKEIESRNIEYKGYIKDHIHLEYWSQLSFNF